MDFYGTIGPACADLDTLRALRAAGMTGIRLNLSHGPLAARQDWLALLREAGISRLLIDLQGPELRIGELAGPLTLDEGDTLLLGEQGVGCPAALVAVARPGQQLLLDDGRLLARVESTDGHTLRCSVARGGVLQSRKSIAAPGLSTAQPALTGQDLENLRVAADCGVTGVMLPFVRGLQDVLELKWALADCGAPEIEVFAKIENQAGVDALPEFVRQVDHVVIARGDLGNAMPLWQLPGCQKRLAAICRAAGTPFMVVTQMLDSMHTRAVPTRAEVSDIYNAVLDGAASLMLTGETAAGRYPVQAMEYLVRTAGCALADIAPQKPEIPVVAGLIWNADRSRVLLCQRPAHKAHGLLWEFPGGKIEPGESGEQALARECREELAVTLAVERPVETVVHAYPELTIRLTLYHAWVSEGEPQPLEHREIRWVPVEQLGQYDLAPADRRLLAAVPGSGA